MLEAQEGLVDQKVIGRQEEIRQIKERLQNDIHTLLLYGQPLVGKASLAIQAASELCSDFERRGMGRGRVYTVDCVAANDWITLLQAMCQAFSLHTSVANENVLVNAVSGYLTSTREGPRLLLLLRLNGLKAVGRDVDNLNRCLQLLASCGVITMVTSRRRLQLPFAQVVRPLKHSDALKLFRHRAPGVDVTDFDQILQRHCFGLPPLILQVARLVSGNSFLSFSASELKQALQSDPDMLINEIDEAKMFMNLNPDIKDHVTSLVHLLGGTFSQKALQAALGDDRNNAKSILRRVCDDVPYIIQTNEQHISIDPIVLHHVRRLGHVTADDQARLRVVTLLGRVLVRAEQDLYVSGQDIVYGHLHDDWPNLQHILRQAIHCTVNSYHAYLQEIENVYSARISAKREASNVFWRIINNLRFLSLVALGADKLLVKCFPEEAQLFYRDMAVTAGRFGSKRDQAILEGLIGMSATQGQGTGWDDALDHFHRALPVLREEPCSVHLLRLLCDMGSAYFRLNQLQESDRYLRDAISVSHKIEVDDSRQVLYLLIRVRSMLALPAIFRGHIASGKSLLLETLEICSQEAPRHPDLPVLINSLGLVYERSDESQDLALHYYQQSLVERRRYADVAPGDLVPTLNNVGMQYARRNNFDAALRYLEEAAMIRAQIGRWHYYTALTQQHLGHVCLQRGDYKRAENHLHEAAVIYKRCTPKHDVRGKVELCLAHVYTTNPCRDVANVRKHLKQVCQLAEETAEDMSDNGILVFLSAVQHLVHLMGWRRSHHLIDMANRQLAKFDGDLSKQFMEHQSVLAAMSDLINRDATKHEKETVTLRVINLCQMCCLLQCSADVHELWQHIETKIDHDHHVLKRLLTSAAVTDILHAQTDTSLSTVDSNRCVQSDSAVEGYCSFSSNDLVSAMSSSWKMNSDDFTNSSRSTGSNTKPADNFSGDLFKDKTNFINKRSDISFPNLHFPMQETARDQVQTNPNNVPSPLATDTQKSLQWFEHPNYKEETAGSCVLDTCKDHYDPDQKLSYSSHVSLEVMYGSQSPALHTSSPFESCNETSHQNKLNLTDEWSDQHQDGKYDVIKHLNEEGLPSLSKPVPVLDKLEQQCKIPGPPDDGFSRPQPGIPEAKTTNPLHVTDEDKESHSPTSPELTLFSTIVTCAQRLVTVVQPSQDKTTIQSIVTEEQRHALEKLATLKTTIHSIVTEEQRHALEKLATLYGTNTNPVPDANQWNSAPNGDGNLIQNDKSLSTSDGSASNQMPGPSPQTNNVTLETRQLLDFQRPERTEPYKREATENDERLEGAEHICTNNECTCSLTISP